MCALHTALAERIGTFRNWLLFLVDEHKARLAISHIKPHGAVIECDDCAEGLKEREIEWEVVALCDVGCIAIIVKLNLVVAVLQCLLNLSNDAVE